MIYSYINQLADANAELLKENLHKKYQYSFENLRNLYIFGTGLLGDFVYLELQKNNIAVQGFIDNNKEKQGQTAHGIKIYSITEIGKEETVMIASLMYWYEIKKQLEELNFKNFFSYEELALAVSKFPNYNQSFYNFFETIAKQGGGLLSRATRTVSGR